MEWYYAENDEQRGPISEDALISLVQEGVIQAETLVWNDSMADWRTYGEVQAESDPLRANPTVVTGQMFAPPVEVKPEPLAIASLVLGIVAYGCGFPAAIAAVICGHTALGRIRAAGDRVGGRKLAVAGLVLGYVNLAIHLVSTLIMVISYSL